MLGALRWQWLHSSSWCKGLQPRGPDGQGGRRLCGSARQAWREKGWYLRRNVTAVFEVCLVNCTVLWTWIHLCFVRRMVLDSQQGSSTAAIESQKEFTPWLCNRPSHQKVSSSYLHQCCKWRNPDPHLITSILNFDFCHYSENNRRLHKHTGLNRNNFRLLVSQQHSACAKTHICFVPGTALLFPAPWGLYILPWCYSLILYHVSRNQCL